MSPYIIKITEYCSKNGIETDFLYLLEKENLIELHFIDNEYWIDDSQFKPLEEYARWYYDLSINIEGIDVIRNLLDRMDNMQTEISRLREQLRLLD
ncbi:hypothetical protein GGR21_003044 [Dysgonomonas hofstadii]|uniref:MerR HTH family regulatory protein n=1 Tax=Dysgonomonas hofstadii TaxID=637886 RepID=A0A840CR34_9BACT|nr:chaperone modulator CbpM [Dysgonomonas hofstadii]MBB4037129.1 hypothetical protein [Dysgonomonas hofstadii]